MAVKQMAPWVEELVENEYARKNLTEAAEKFQAAYRRSQKRRIKAARDERLRRQIRDASASLAEGVRAVTDHREHPKRHWGKRLLVIGGIAAVAVAGVKAATKQTASP